MKECVRRSLPAAVAALAARVFVLSLNGSLLNQMEMHFRNAPGIVNAVRTLCLCWIVDESHF